MIVAPKNTFRPKGLTGAYFAGVVAPHRSDLAYQSTHPAVCLCPYVKAGLKEEVKPRYGVTGESDAEALHRAVPRLYNKASPVLRVLRRGVGDAAQAEQCP